MPKVHQFLFGPGSLEMVRLDQWVSKVESRVDGTRARKIKSKVVGNYDIYCGTGNMHRVHIKIEDSVWNTEAGLYTKDIVAAHEGDEDAARRITEAMIGWELDDWFDPCEEDTI
jgi:hypothetical protein